MAYIRHIKAGSTHLRIPDLVDIDKDVTDSRDFNEMSSERECVPSANTHAPAASGLHIKHNHSALISACNVKSAQHGSNSGGMSMLKRSNQVVPYSPSGSKIPKLSHRSVPLLTINNVTLNKTSSVSKMSTLLKSQGLATPNKHFRDVPNYKQPSAYCVPVEDKPLVNISWFLQSSSQNYHSPVKQVNKYIEPSATVSTLETNSSVQWRHYGIGQQSVMNGSYHYMSTTMALPERHTPYKNTVNPYNKLNFYTSSPRVHPQYKLMQRKPSTPVHLVRDKHTHLLKAVPCISQGSNNTVQGQKAQKDIIAFCGNVYISPEEMSNKQPGNAVRRIHFNSENETGRQPCDDINFDADFNSGNMLVPSLEPGVSVDNVNIQELERYFNNKTLKQRNNLLVFDLCEQLKNIKPYVISGWISSTYLFALMQKSNLVNEMFDNALDEVGDIRPEVVKHCRKTTPAILAKDLVFRLFTLEQLNGMNLQKLSKKKMWAIHRCLKKHFPDFNLRCWRKKCIPQIKSSVLTLFRHRVKHVQEFWVSHGNSQPIDLTTAV